jgi:arabinose-5-phosphate isomerase
LNLAPTSSTTATLALGDALACAASYCRDFSPENFVQFHPGGTLGKRLLVKVKDVMLCDNIPSVLPTTDLKTALGTINEGKMGVAVVLEDGVLKGIITSGDIRRAIDKMGAKCLDMPLNNFMTQDPVTISENLSLYDAEKVFQEHMVHVLVVTNDANKCVGLLDVNYLS